MLQQLQYDGPGNTDLNTLNINVFFHLPGEGL